MLAVPDATTLLDLPANPRPAGAVCEMIRAADGVGLRTAHWPALTPRPKGTVCLFHGRSEFIEKYYEVIRDLRARGFAVATLDWRGQGGSDRLIEDGRLGHIADFSHFARDLDAFIRQIALPECPSPFFALAHSMGASILFAHLAERSPWFERMVAIAPMIDLVGLPPAPRLIARSLCGVGLSRRLVPGWSPKPVVLRPFEGNPVTSDRTRYAHAAAVAEAAPKLAIGGPTIGWVRAAFRAMDTLGDPGFGQDWRMPTLAVLAGEDRVVSTLAAESFVRKLRATRAVTVPGALHEVMQERDGLRDRFWAAFDAFVPGRG
ncbi:alpha/beta fold hydrolase [Labrys wisconsinensis]|uniref:Lysophospholipase n=1 Tax=Labrys wisconsinensis TaxID=425677 RepID=A0ABU0J451_9HYPH|nr:alpha/beta hydrolase [Labrys wisconsinensis]MDQ0468193.1 lysophospholipase [Labrys wisconsinensis]